MKDPVLDDEFLQKNRVFKLHPKNPDHEIKTKKQDTPDISFNPQLFGEVVGDWITSHDLGGAKD